MISLLQNRTESHDVNTDSFFNTAGLAVGFQEWFLHPQPLLLNVFRFIEEHYQESISLRDVAVAVGRSPAYLTDLVRQKTGKTVLAWIIECRMAEARRLLLETSQTIEQIAEAAGYFDRRHFSRQFLRCHGTTPQAWRKTHQSWSIPLSQIDLQKVIPSNLIKHRATTMTTAEAQRLQVCVQEIAAILYKNTTTSVDSENLRQDNDEDLQSITEKILAQVSSR